jgi:hypothetical protein
MKMLVILSLMHQISLDLSKHTGMKLSWLQECVLNLNKSEPVISEHVPRILSIVNKRLEELVKKLMTEDPSSSHLRNAKMLQLMTSI